MIELKFSREPGWYQAPGQRKGLEQYWNGERWVQSYREPGPSSDGGGRFVAGILLVTVAMAMVLFMLSIVQPRRESNCIYVGMGGPTTGECLPAWTYVTIPLSLIAGLVGLVAAVVLFATRVRPPSGSDRRDLGVDEDGYQTRGDEATASDETAGMAASGEDRDRTSARTPR